MPPARRTPHAAPTLARSEAVSQCFCHKSCLQKFDSAINKTWLKQRLERTFCVCYSWAAAVGQPWSWGWRWGGGRARMAASDARPTARFHCCLNAASGELRV